MARPISEIQNEIIEAKNADTNLDAVNSTSNVADWRLWTYIVAYSIHILERMWDAFRVDVEDYIARNRVHTLRWYRDTVLAFREGKDIFWNDGVFTYPDLEDGETLDDLQIVDQAAVVESPGALLIKVATTGSGGLQPVTDDQAERILFYMNEVKDAGNRIVIVNHQPDELEITGVIYADPLLINMSDGSLVSDPTVFPLLDALDEYVNDENIENFNGSLRRTHLVDALQKAEGMRDPVLTSVKARYGSLPFEEIPISYLPFSGYFTISNTSFQYLPYE